MEKSAAEADTELRNGTGSLLTMSGILCAAHLVGREAPSLAKLGVS